MSKPGSLWRPRPIHKAVIDEIAKHGGRITERELYRILREEYGYDISLGELYKVIMSLELRGFIVVNKVGRDLAIAFSEDFIKGRV